MSREHFRALADAISQISCADERKRTAELIGNVCTSCNDRFNWSVWNNACRVTSAALALTKLGGQLIWEGRADCRGRTEYRLHNARWGYDGSRGWCHF